ncbi:MAG: glycine cleavage system protein GcvH [Nitrospinae bacterium]|nr:glycine cleavage system protein GcvH [Nitrospinota bacterium]
MKFPDNLKYTKDHEWARVDGDTVVVGITDFAQHELGDIVFVELPATGRTLSAGETFGVAESVKTVSDLYSPISGEVVEVNDGLEGRPELVNKEPYGGGWMIKIKPSNPAEVNSLLTSAAYSALIKEGH